MAGKPHAKRAPKGKPKGKRGANKMPSMTLHKATGQARVTLSGRTVYLGKWGTPEAEARYHEVLGDWAAHGRTLPAPPERITVNELLLAFTDFAEREYSPGELEPLRAGIARAVKHLGALRVSELGPKRLRRYQEALAGEHYAAGDTSKPLARSTVNHYVAILKRIVKWGVSEELVEPSVYHGLQAVSSLRKGRGKAREAPKVRPVPEAHRRAVLLKAPKVLRDMIRIQTFCGCRPGELCALTRADIDTSGPVWVAKLERHKGAWRDTSEPRVIAFGPKAQRILKPYLLRKPNEYLFNPKEAIRQRAAARPTHRRANQKPTPRETGRTVGACYTVASYRRAVHRLCEEAGVPKWSPHQLRKNAATRVREKFGLDAAQIALGHARADVTQIYAELNAERLAAIMETIG